ncbi:MAG: T9SS type A sorting domain-containing protein [Cyclobacteriaceae bacterium]
MENFKKYILSLLFLTITYFTIAQVSAIYAGGPIYYGRDYSIDELKRSGYNTIIVWTIHIDASGNLNFNGEFPLVTNGEYVGDKAYPHFRDDIKELKSLTSSINRIEFGLSAWRSGTYDHIKALVESEGSGPDSRLYKNFKALKEAIPEIDAMNNDDEGTYDVNSSVSFHTMLFELGFKTAIVPYTVSFSYWKPFTEQMNAANPGSVDRLYLQVYAGGAGNNPCSSSWDFGIPVYPGVWGEGTSQGNRNPEEVLSVMTSWRNSCDIDGGFMWLYDDFDDNPLTAQYAASINNAFGILPDKPVAAFDEFPTKFDTEVSIDANLKWSTGGFGATHKVYYGTSANLTDNHLVQSSTLTTYDPGTQENNTTYYWRVDQENTAGTTAGDLWSYTTEVVTPQPGAITSRIPSNEAKYVSLKPLLSWQADNVVSSDVYFGDSDVPFFKRNVENAQYEPEELDRGTTYYWKVDTQNSKGKTEGELVSFTTRGINLAALGEVSVSSEMAGSQFDDGNLIDGFEKGLEWGTQDEADPSAQISWDIEQALGAVVLYDRLDDEENVLSGILSFSDESSLEVGPLPKDGQELLITFDRKDVSWIKFQITNSEGDLVGLSEIEAYEYIAVSALPDQSRNFEPEDNALNLESQVTLRWERGLFADSHDIYVSNDETIDASDFVLNKKGKFHVLSDLANGTYYWRIDAVNDNGVTEGPLLNFEVGKALGTKGAKYSASIFPNPASEEVRITLPQNTYKTIRLVIYDLNGSVVYDRDQMGFYSSNDYLLWRLEQNNSKVNSGLYLAKVITDLIHFEFKIFINE